MGNYQVDSNGQYLEQRKASDASANRFQFVLFFGGLSFHMCKALICHACSINMEWTTTAKELEGSGFRLGLDRIVRDFKWMYAFLIPIIGGMIYLACFAPRGWTIKDFTAIVPIANQVGCHALLPFALGLF